MQDNTKEESLINLKKKLKKVIYESNCVNHDTCSGDDFGMSLYYDKVISDLRKKIDAMEQKKRS